MKLIDRKFGDVEDVRFSIYSELFYEAVRYMYEKKLISDPNCNRGVRYNYISVICSELLPYIESKIPKGSLLSVKDILSAWSDLRFIRRRKNGKEFIYPIKRNGQLQKALYFKRNAVKVALAESQHNYLR